MSGVRVSCFPEKVTLKDIQIHFTKPENGGGAIKDIYYPLFSGHAVVMFEEAHTAETVLLHEFEHIIRGGNVFVSAIPALQVFPVLCAQLDPTVAAFLQATEEVRDEIQHHGNLEYQHDDQTNTSTIRGNWYQLEWAWKYIDDIMKKQMRLQNDVALGQPFRSRGTHEQTTKFTEDIQLPKGNVPVKGADPIISMPASNDDERQGQTKDRSSVRRQRVGSTDDDKGSLKNPQMKIEVESDDEDDDFHSPRTSQNVHNRKGNGESSDDTAKYVRSQDPKPSGSRDAGDTVILNDNPEDVRSLDFQYGGLRVSIYTGELTMEETDAIVNAAMGSLFNGGGVAYAIASAASPDMQKQCDDFVRNNGSLNTSEVTHTCAGGRISPKVKFVLHAVGPVYSTSLGEETCAHLLTQTFLNCMLYGNNKLKINSVAMPVISSGIFGCPLELCVKSFLDAVLLFVTKQSDAGVLHLQEVHLVNNSSDNTAITVLLLRQLMEDGIDQCTKKALQQFNKMSVEDGHHHTRRDSDRASGGQRLEGSRTTKPTSIEPSTSKASTSGKGVVPKTEGRPQPPIPVDSTSKPKKK